MGLFTRLEKQEIQGLEDELLAQQDAHLASVEHMAQEIAKLRNQLAERAAETMNLKSKHMEDTRILAAHHDEKVRRLTAQAETNAHLAEMELARRAGQIKALEVRGNLLDLVSQQHTWVRDGQASVHGMRMDVWKCEHCVRDPIANPRILVPVGTKWRAVQDE